MADITIPDLPSTATANDNDQAIIRQGSIDYRTDVSNFKAGLLTVANNLSDLNNAATARVNLGVDTSQFAALDTANDYGYNVQEAMQLLSYTEYTEALGNSGAALTIDTALANVFSTTITADVTLTFTVSAGANQTMSFTLLVEDGGNHAVTFPGTVRWQFGSAPLLTENGIDILTFVTFNNGTNWYGFISGTDFS